MTSLVDRTISNVLNEQRRLESYNYLDNLVSNFKLGTGRVNDLNIEMFKLDVPAFKPSVSSFNDKIFNQVTVNPIPIKKAEAKPIPLQNYKVDNMKPIKIENAFGTTIVKSDVQPLVHKNPQKYQYLLNKYDVKDIAMKRLDIEHGYENEFSKIFEDFYVNDYLKSLESIDVENIDAIKAYQPIFKKDQEVANMLKKYPNSEMWKKIGKKELKNVPDLQIDNPEDVYYNLYNEKNPNKKLSVNEIIGINNSLAPLKIKLPFNTTVAGAKHQMEKYMMEKTRNVKGDNYKKVINDIIKKKENKAPFSVTPILGAEAEPEREREDDIEDVEDDDIYGDIIKDKQTFQGKPLAELGEIIDLANGDMIINSLQEGLTTGEKIDEMIEALTTMIQTKQQGKTIGKIQAQKLNQILSDNGKIKYIHANSGSKALLIKKDGLLAVSVLYI